MSEPGKRLVTYSDADREFIDSAVADGRLDKCRLTLIDSRAKRLGCSPHELEMMKSYELALELADEESILSGPDYDSVPATYIDWDAIDAIARGESRVRAAAFDDFLKQMLALKSG